MSAPTPEMVERLERELAALDEARESADILVGDLASLRYAKWQELMDARSALADSTPKADGYERRLSPLGDSRERMVLCRTPGCMTKTLAYNAQCDSHEWERTVSDGAA